MPDPTILDLTGVEIEIRAVRGLDNPFLATITLASGAALDLANYDVTMTVVDRPGGTVKFTRTNTPADHVSPSTAGQTRFVVDADVTSALTGQRSYTWKYQVIVRDRVTDQKYRAFYGDFRVVPTAATV